MAAKRSRGNLAASGRSGEQPVVANPDFLGFARLWHVRVCTVVDNQDERCVIAVGNAAVCLEASCLEWRETNHLGFDPPNGERDKNVSSVFEACPSRRYENKGGHENGRGLPP